MKIEEPSPQNRTEEHSLHFLQNESKKFNLIKLINKSSDLMKQINENHSLLYEIENITEKSEKPNPTWETIQQQYEFTSGHQNNFGIPIEEDERMLNFLKVKNKVKFMVQSSTTESHYKVSPTLPIVSNKLKDNQQNNTEEGELYLGY